MIFFFSASDALPYQIKTLIGFLCKPRLNLKFLIQLSKTLLIELNGTYKINGM